VSESIIKEIIDLVAYTKNKQAHEIFVFPKPSQPTVTIVKTKSPEIQIHRKSLLPSAKSKDLLKSPSMASSFGAMSLGRRRSKLKVNNVLIGNDLDENENIPEKDYILISSVTHEEQINSYK